MRIQLGLLIAVVACGGGGGGSVPLDQLGTRLGNASCTKLFQCCSAAEIMTYFQDVNPPITTEPQCEQFLGGFFNALALPDYQASVAAGRIRYDGDAAGACMDAVASLSCSQYGGAKDVTVDCGQFIIPLVADGGGCTQSYECTSNNCVGATVQPGGPNTDGRCQPMPAVGQPCTSSCAAGAYCGFDQSSGMEVCIAQKADGASCNTADECASGACNGTGSGSTGTCGAPAPTCTGGG